jgi:hypothetical protein
MYVCFYSFPSHMNHEIGLNIWQNARIDYLKDRPSRTATSGHETAKLREIAQKDFLKRSHNNDLIFVTLRYNAVNVSMFFECVHILLRPFIKFILTIIEGASACFGFTDKEANFDL